MFVTKFTVPIARKIYTDVLKYASRGRQCDKKVNCKPTTRRAETASERKECQKELSKHPIPPNQYCKLEPAADNYQKVYQDTKNRGEAIMKSFQNESSLILDQLKKDISASSANEKIALERLSHNIKKKLQQLLLLDPTCGSLKRKSAMSLNHQVRQAFEKVENDIMLQTKRINTIIQKLECDVLTCTDRAKSLILSCSKSNNPLALNKCIEENANYAKKILDKTSKHAQIGLNRIETLQREILDYNKAAVAEISRTFSQKNKAFSEYLDDCIFAIRKEKKR